MFVSFLERHAFIRTNRRAIAMMFVRPSVCLSGTGVDCDYTVHLTEDLSLWLVVQCSGHPESLTPKHVHLLPTVFFQFHLGERWGMDVFTHAISA